MSISGQTMMARARCSIAVVAWSAAWRCLRISEWRDDETTYYPDLVQQDYLVHIYRLTDGSEIGDKQGLCSQNMLRLARRAWGGSLGSSAAVSSASCDHQMIPSSWASWRIEAISADPAVSISLVKSIETSFPEGEGYLEIASAAWLLVLASAQFETE